MLKALYFRAFEGAGRTQDSFLSKSSQGGIKGQLTADAITVRFFVTNNQKFMTFSYKIQKTRCNTRFTGKSSFIGSHLRSD